MKSYLAKLFEKSLKVVNHPDNPADIDRESGAFSTEAVMVGAASFSAVDILRAGPEAYKVSFNTWLDEEFKTEREALGDTLTALATNRERMDTLGDAVKRGTVVPYVGARYSMSSQYPGWGAFLRQVAEEVACDVDSVQTMMSRGEYEEAAELIASKCAGQEFDERCDEKFKLRSVDSVQGALWLLPSLFDGLIITTNFDRLLEHVFSASGKRFNDVKHGSNCPDLRELVSNRLHALYKLHGDHGDPNSRVLTRNEFDRYYAAGSQLRLDFEDMVTHQTLLFLGCSLGNDRPVQMMKAAFARDRRMPRHYAFLEYPDDASDAERTRIHLAEANIFPIWYGSADEREYLGVDKDLYNQAFLYYLAKKKDNAGDFKWSDEIYALNGMQPVRDQA